jgi:capsular polysaccharide biosynthesis protein
MVPQMGSATKGGLSNLASMAGIDMGMAESADVSPILYPKIVSSNPFMLELMNTPVHFSAVDTMVSLYTYYTDIAKPGLLGIVKNYTIGLPSVILGALIKPQKELALPGEEGEQPLSITKEQYELKKKMVEKITLQVDKKEGYLTLSVTMPEALAAAEMAQKAQVLLQDYITRFKVEKSQAELDFIQERYNQTKAEATREQYGVAVDQDRFKDLVSQVPQVKTSRKQMDYAISNSVFQELAKQLEQAKIQVAKDTPVFTIVEPVAVPTENSGPSRLRILVIWFILGIIIGGVVIFSKAQHARIKEKWNAA